MNAEGAQATGDFPPPPPPPPGAGPAGDVLPMSREVLERRVQQQQDAQQALEEALERHWRVMQQQAEYIRLAELNQQRPWMAQIFCHMHFAPVHHLGHFLDRKDFAALETTAATMHVSVQKIIRARNQRLPPGMQMPNHLEGAFSRPGPRTAGR